MSEHQAANSPHARQDKLADGQTTDSKTVRPRSRFTPGNSIAMVVVVILLVSLLISAARKQNFQWPVVFQYFFDPSILGGLLTTIELTILAVAIGLLLGIGIAVLHISRNPVLTGIGRVYVWLFRGTPLLVQLIFWFNLSALYPRLSLSLAFGPELGSVDTNTVITPFAAALLGLGLHAAGYMAEVVRGGILGVSKTQREAASALGMTRFTQFRKIVWPQALRLIVPALGNRVVSELKDTSLVSVIAMPDLLYSAQLIYSRTYQTIPLLVVATLWYLIAVSLLTLCQKLLERRLAPDTAGSSARAKTAAAE
jgi:polar amino acid transport system permease protein